jgi:DNA-binding transcriptional MerR regulator/quercetin dioxygenase-like cupin family protein
VEIAHFLPFLFMPFLQDLLDGVCDTSHNTPRAKMARVALYYKISQAATLLGVSPSSLRNWERLGLLTPVRSQGKHRLYSRDQLQKLSQIKFWRKVKGVNLAGIAEMLQRRGGRAETKGPAGNSHKNIGQQLGRLRRQMRLSLSDVARRTGLSVSFLSGLERGQVNASIASLQKLAHVYGTNVLSFFGAEGHQRRLVQPKDRRILRPNPGVQMELLAFGTTAMEPHLFRIAPGATSGGAYEHEGEEFIYVVQGSLEIWLDEVERYVLKPGDSLYFESNHSHRWRSIGEKETLLLWINTPPTF